MTVPGGAPAGAELHTLTAADAAAAIRAGAITSERLVAACLERVAAREDTVHAWAHLDPDRALAEARARDAEVPSGPLHGVPVGVKDLIDTADAPTTYGSTIYAGHHPIHDAACVTRLRRAGAVIIGKTVTTEFALFHPGPTTNPHDPRRTPGGSSSGSAAAVADHMVPVALGTQTAGSIIRPAAFCGIFGFKPTFGTVPTGGVRAIAPSLDTVGVLARTVDDLGLLTAVMAGDADGFEAPDAPPTVAFATTGEWEQADAGTRQALLDIARRLDLPRATLPDDFAGLVHAQSVIMDREAADALDHERRTHPDQLSDGLRRLLDRGRAVSDDALDAARAVAAACRWALSAAFGEHDALLVPAVIGEAPEDLHATGDPLFCRIWTLLGAPAVAVPGLRGPHGLPLGVQVVAPPGRDGTVLAAAAWVATALREVAA